MKIYLASSFKNEEINQKLVELLEKEGFICHLPQRDTPQEPKELTVKTNKEAISNSDLLIVVGLNYGISYGNATCWEMGYAKALDKKIICLGNLEEDDFQNRLNVDYFVKSEEELLNLLNKLK